MKKIIIVGICCLLLGIVSTFIFFRFIQEQKIPVLGYHDIVPDEQYNHKNFFTLKLSTFKKQMKYLKKNGWTTLSMKEYECWKNRKCKFPRKTVVLTFDDGYESVYNHILPVLKEYKFKATAFIIFDHVQKNINKKKPYLTLEMIKSSKEEYKDLEYQSHSYALHNRDIRKKAKYKEYMEDIKKVKEIYPEIQYFAYPEGYFDEDYIKALKENNYKLAFTYGPYANSRRNDDNYKIPRQGITENIPYWKWKLKLNLLY